MQQNQFTVQCSLFIRIHVKKTGIFLNRIKENIRQLVVRRKNIEICVFFSFLSRLFVCLSDLT